MSAEIFSKITDHTLIQSLSISNIPRIGSDLDSGNHLDHRNVNFIATEIGDHALDVNVAHVTQRGDENNDRQVLARSKTTNRPNKQRANDSMHKSGTDREEAEE